MSILNSEKSMESPPRRRCANGLRGAAAHGRVARGFSLVEALVGLGVLLIVCSLMLPAFQQGRVAARATTALARLRDLGILTVAYATDNRDMAPVLFRPIYGAGREDRQAIDVDGYTIRGHWFNNSNYFHLLFDTPPPAEALRDPGNPARTSFSLRGVGTTAHSDYMLAECLYAEPAFYNVRTQVGPAQWVPQRLGTVLFPAQKGFAKQLSVYDRPHVVPAYPACCFSGVRSAVQWADLSATTEDQSALNHPAPNFWHHGLSGAVPLWAGGVPIDSTVDGVRGRDR